MEEGLRKKLERSAKKNRQSLNSEMVERLERSLEPPVSEAPARQRDALVSILLGSDEAAELMQHLAFTIQTMRGGWPQTQDDARLLAAELSKEIYSQLDPTSEAEQRQ